jgi:LuxR family quorum-sensing system transcriptional regulator SolR
MSIDKIAPQGSTIEEIFISISAISEELGFEFCTFGVRVPLPITRPRTVYVSNYPHEWQSHYNEQKYFDIDPTVAHGMRSSEAIVWSDKFFKDTPQLWREAQQHGVCHGWALSRRDVDGVYSMLILARPSPAITLEELAEKEGRMRQLCDASHLALKECIARTAAPSPNPKLSDREIDVLRWTADGKTASEIADILGISERTVNFHINQVVAKLQASNKTNAAVRAAVKGLLW